MSARIQEWIHKFEESGTSRWSHYFLAVVVMLALAVSFNLTNYRNLATQEGMDFAQLALNLADGKGFTTSFVRPLSVHLVESHRPDRDPLLRQAHPDLANPPVYPVLLALVLMAMPFDTPDLATPPQSFSVYLPDLWIAIFNQGLLLVAAAMIFFFARSLFDEGIGWLTVAVLLGSELVWRFTVSGLSTILLIVIFLALAAVLMRLESCFRDQDASFVKTCGFAALAGIVVGIAFLTRYSLAVLMMPLVVWMAAYCSRRQWIVVGSSVLAFALTAMPWIMRNLAESGTPLGTASFAICHLTSQFPDTQLERSLAPDFHGLTAADFFSKLIVGLREIVGSELPKLGGSWVSAFFLVGLIVPFRNPAINRLRIFLILCIAAVAIVQALGRTSLSIESPEVNSENSLVLLAPLVFMLGCSFFVTLIEKAGAGSVMIRPFLVVGFVLLCSSQLITSLLPPYRSALAFPPYYPPWFGAKMAHVDRNSLVMSDVPWAVGWYGHRQSVWLPLKYRSNPQHKVAQDFLAIDGRRPVSALYIGSKSMKAIEATAIWRWVHGSLPEWDWDSFVLGVLLKLEVPDGFRLNAAPEGVVPEIFLTDSERGVGKTIQSK